MRLAIFAPHFAEYSCRLAIGLSERADVLLMVDEDNRRREVRPELWDAVSTRVATLEFNSVGRANRACSLARIISQTILFRPSVVILEEQIDKLTAWVARTIGRLFPILLTIHDPKPHSGKDWQYVRDNWQNRRTIRNSAVAYHVHGPACREQLRGEVEFELPVHTFPHGAIFVPEPREIRAPERGRILMFGRMEAFKGLETLLDAIDLLEVGGTDFKVTIAGKGPELDRLRPRTIDRPLVEILDGFLPPAEATAQFQRASIVVTPYTDATGSGVVAAAFGNGRPVVASRTGGLVDDVAEDVNGVFAQPNDPAALAVSLSRLLRDPELLARLTAGAQSANVGRLAWSTIAAGLTEACREIAS